MEADSKPAQLKMSPPPLNNLFNANNIVPVHIRVHGYIESNTTGQNILRYWQWPHGRQYPQDMPHFRRTDSEARQLRASERLRCGRITRRTISAIGSMYRPRANLPLLSDHTVRQELLGVAPCPITTAMPAPSCSTSSHGPCPAPPLKGPVGTYAPESSSNRE